MITIKCVSSPNGGSGIGRIYVVAVDGQEVCAFTHRKGDGLTRLMRRAAAAVGETLEKTEKKIVSALEGE